MSRGTRPPSFALSWHALLSLPMRICNPPPAASRVRSCKVTPLVKVTLDDVLNKRHLPPLTLKDFEEWLVFVEGNPQYLYFILWLREYEARYAAWLADSGCAIPAVSPTNSTTTLGDDPDPDRPCTPHDRDLSYVNLIPSSAPLALFFTRAKQTFLDPASSSPYGLGHAALLALAPSTHSLAPSIPQFTIPSDYDTRYTVGSLPPSLAKHPHPHPKELAPLASYARQILKECLQRFSETACQNVGTRRAWCGIAGGTFLTLVVGIVPALVAYFFAPYRWWRAIGWFGCWLGGTIIMSSFHGICMMIYVFGDLRQLRSFELARPSISGPRAIARARPRLKSFFTREGEEKQTDIGDPGTGSGSATGTGHPTPAQPVGRNAVELTKSLVALQNTGEERGTKKSPGKGPRSAGCASHTSTGTPVVHLGTGAFKFGLGTGTTESEESALAGSGEIIVGETLDDQGARLNDDDFGIEISPVYYYSGQGPMARDDEKTDRRGSVRSAGSGSKIGRVMQWVMGGRGSVGTVTETWTGSGVGAKAASVVSEKTTQLQSQTRSHIGTFGIRSWRGGLGSLLQQSCNEGQDLEKCFYATQTVQEVEELTLDDPDFVNEDATLEVDDVLTAEFITHDYPELEPHLGAALGTHSELGPGPDKEKAMKTKRGSSFVSPVKFDFDKLPAAAAARRMSSPCTFAPFPVSPCTVSDRAPTPPQTVLLRPPPALYTHPGARLATPTPLSLVIPCPRPISTSNDRQWWDTCPRHPAVEASLGSAVSTPTPAILTHSLPRPTSSTRPTSLVSSDVHSRVRVNVCPVPTDPPRKSALRPKTSFSSSRSSETWRTRFRRVMAVPAFGPLTRVLEPVVSRGQWEIVVRSACAAALGAWIFIGCLVALPEAR